MCDLCVRRESVPLLFLDLDGTVRHGYDQLGRFVNGPDDVVIFPEAIEMMRRWKAGGGRILGVTNQGGVALGHLTPSDCNAALAQTAHLAEHLFDGVTACMHHPDADDPIKARCWCRKPKPGLLIEGTIGLRAMFGEYYPLHMALMVGDRPEDEAAAAAAGVDFQWAADWRAQATTTGADRG